MRKILIWIMVGLVILVYLLCILGWILENPIINIPAFILGIGLILLFIWAFFLIIDN
jgi:hypothetical protein